MIFKKLIRATLITFSLCTLPLHGQHNEAHVSHRPLTEKQMAKKIETYLQRPVSGLNATYRDVLNAIIKEGHNVYIKGGLIRDLFSNPPVEPKDLDFDFTCSADEIKTILIKNGWMFSHKPGSFYLIIGNDKIKHIGATAIIPSNDYKDVNTLEFTVNNIFYHVNTETFIPESMVGFDDLVNKRIRVISNDWEKWLTGDKVTPYRYNKIFRYWKMIGKGYRASPEFSRFMKEKSQQAVKENWGEFASELIGYLSNHLDNFNSLIKGSCLVHGTHWTESYICSIYHLALLKHHVREKKRLEKYTFHGHTHTAKQHNHIMTHQQLWPQHITHH